MKCWRSRATAGLVAAALGLAASADDGQARRRTPVVEVFERCRGAVVNIAATRKTEVNAGALRGFFDDIFEYAPRLTRSIGSGFIVHRDGYLVTNAHVIAAAVELKIVFDDKTELDAEIIATDPAHDIAVLKVEAPRPLPFLTIGRSDDLMIGETVVAIGDPLGYKHTCTSGIISALDRELAFARGVAYRGLIQTDASINPGNSGGPLLNINGELIGVNTAIRGDAQNIGFAIPADQLRQLLPSLLDVERLRRVKFGLHFGPDRPFNGGDAAWRGGPSIEKVDEGSPAATAGLRPGDLVLAIGDRPTPNFLEAFSIIDQTPAGQSVELTLGREDQTLRKSVLLAAIPKPDGGKLMWERLGLRVREMNEREMRALGLRQPIGLVVTNVSARSEAGELGMEPGDFITKIAGRESRSLDFVGHLLEIIEAGSTVYVGWMRVDGGSIYRADVRLRVR